MVLVKSVPRKIVRENDDWWLEWRRGWKRRLAIFKFRLSLWLAFLEWGDWICIRLYGRPLLSQLLYQNPDAVLGLLVVLGTHSLGGFTGHKWASWGCMSMDLIWGWLLRLAIESRWHYLRSPTLRSQPFDPVRSGLATGKLCTHADLGPLTLPLGSEKVFVPKTFVECWLRDSVS